jgi:2-deoxy-D-gluconate 3-dehydrogenase
MKLFDLKGKTAIVTGGNGGIGFGIAHGLAVAGANIVVAGRNEAKNATALETLQKDDHSCVAVKCDVAIDDDITICIEKTLTEFVGIDILVNNAGVSGGGAPERMDDEVWEEVISVNLTSVMKFSRACHSHMKAAGAGKIINIGSMYSLFGSPMVSPYSASKGGVIQLTRSLATSWARHNIQVNAILPGWITTDMTAGAMDNRAFYDLIIARTPAGRFGVPEELAGAAVFLASHASDFVTGISLPVDGGYAIA